MVYLLHDELLDFLGLGQLQFGDLAQLQLGGLGYFGRLFDGGLFIGGHPCIGLGGVLELILVGLWVIFVLNDFLLVAQKLGEIARAHVVAARRLMGGDELVLVYLLG